MKKILVLFAHPAQNESKINVKMANAAKKQSHVTLVDLYAQYPAGFIDVELEQKRLLKHDVIVFLHPFYWYSTPPILKLWQDIVLEHGFAYGTKGTKLKGKIFFCAISTGAPEKAYTKTGSNHFTIRQLLAPLEQTANLCGMKFLPPFVLHNANTSLEAGLVLEHVEKWRETLSALTQGRLPINAASKLDNLTKANCKPAKITATKKRRL